MSGYATARAPAPAPSTAGPLPWAAGAARPRRSAMRSSPPPAATSRRAAPAPPALVALHLCALAARGLAPLLVVRALAAIAHAHKRSGLVALHWVEGGAVVAEVLAGIRRSREDAPDIKQAADADVVMQLLGAITGTSLAAWRDRALIAFGMALAARRSELVALDFADLAWEEHGLRVTMEDGKDSCLCRSRHKRHNAM